MSLSWIEIKTRSVAFVNEWASIQIPKVKEFLSIEGMVYNNFPWPDAPSDKQRAAIESAAQGVLDARAAFPDSTLADLYDPVTMPPALVKAHQTLDRTVDAAYGKRHFSTDAQRVAFLFERYQHLTSCFPPKNHVAQKNPRRLKRKHGASGFTWGHRRHRLSL